MDFSLFTKDDKFDFTKYFPAIIDAFAMVGREVEIKKKDKKNFGKIESAFLKDNTDVYDVTSQTEKSIKIKIEVDTCPPLNFKTEQKLLLQPHSFITRCFTLPDLFAGKMHALVYRVWKNRVKGRDWNDFEWYIRHNVPLNFAHLAERVRQFNNEEIGQRVFMAQLKERLASANIEEEPILDTRVEFTYSQLMAKLLQLPKFLQLEIGKALVANASEGFEEDE